MSSLLVGFLVVASLRSVGAVWQTRRAASNRTDRMALAGELMQEILCKPVVDPVDGKTDPFGVDTGESATTRADFDDADDYDDWSATPPQNPDGTLRSEFAGWTRSVTVEHLSNNNPGNVVSDGFTEQGVRRLTVTVVDPEGRTDALVAIQGLLGNTDRAPDTIRANAFCVDTTLRVGSGDEIRTTVQIRSKAFDR